MKLKYTVVISYIICNKSHVVPTITVFMYLAKFIESNDIDTM